jgi:hypothetical protein
MIIKKLFSQNINRHIETVIKAEDPQHILEEVKEYVVTKEISDKIRRFFASYNDYQGFNGVWISGFFGSGKSHLLKIISHILENKEYDNHSLGEIFAEKIEDDEMLKADVIKSMRTPSESILFNIDQQAEITSKQDEGAILNVFYKVFYNHLGYYGSQKHVAEFESWLDGENIYKQFQEEYEQLTGQFWTSDRRKFFDPKVKKSIAEILGKIREDSPAEYLNIIETQKNNIVSIEDFCYRVNTYIKTKAKGFRLNFFVDEVGQYISGNTKLMLNLQTIAETLAVKTNGNSWILVTSQEDMEKVVGDMNKTLKNDFSRIQARFQIKISLTSANVDEVIEKRLLTKTEEAKTLLSDKWEKEKSKMETILSFSEVGVQFKQFKGVNDFTNKFPFIPYQFDLFQQCIKSLSTHNAFQGKHASVGERSMLGVFQEVVKSIESNDDNAIVSFDLLYNGIGSTMRGEIQSTITLAERLLDDEFAIKTLKALFLVKYFTQFKTNKRNISVLMIDNLNIDLKAHEQKISESLKILENQTYIQRNGEIYEFLTNEEKDIEDEIKSVDIDDQDVTNLLNEILFDEIIKDKKIRYLENKQDYDFSNKIDGVSFGRERELTIEIITPNSEEYEQINLFKSQTMGVGKMIIVLPSEVSLLNDLKMYLRTIKYIKQNQKTSTNDSIQAILHNKGQQNNLQRKLLFTTLNDMLGKATVYINGNNHEMNCTSDGKTKVTTAFQDLIKIAYPNLKMLGSAVYSEDEVKNIIRSKQGDLFETDSTSLSEAENEILSEISRRKTTSDRTSLFDLKDRFIKKPYGWYSNAICCTIAKLYKRGRIELKQNSNLLLDENEILKVFSNTKHDENTLIEIQKDIDPKLIRELKKTYQDFFNETCSAKEAKDIANDFKEKLINELETIKELLTHKEKYPFLNDLNSLAQKLEKLKNKDYDYFLTNLKDFEDEILDAKEDFLDPIKQFWKNEQKNIYDAITKFLSNNEANLIYIESDELKKIKEVKNDPKPYSGNLIKEAKSAMDLLNETVKEKLATEKSQAIEAMKKAKEDLQIQKEFNQLDDSKKEELVKPFEEEINKINKTSFIANIRQAKESDGPKLVHQQLNAMISLTTIEKNSDEDTPIEKPKYIGKNDVEINFKKFALETPEDVDQYTEALKEAFIQQIKNNKRIKL